MYIYFFYIYIKLYLCSLNYLKKKNNIIKQPTHMLTLFGKLRFIQTVFHSRRSPNDDWLTLKEKFIIWWSSYLYDFISTQFLEFFIFCYGILLVIEIWLKRGQRAERIKRFYLFYLRSKCNIFGVNFAHQVTVCVI